MASPAMFRQRFNIDVSTETEVTRIDRESAMIWVRDLGNGSSRQEHYDALVLAPGAAPIRPSVAGVDLAAGGERPQRRHAGGRLVSAGQE